MRRGKQVDFVCKMHGIPQCVVKTSCKQSLILVRTKEHRYTCIYTPNDMFDNCNYYTLTLYTMYMKCQIDVHVLNYLENYLIEREL